MSRHGQTRRVWRRIRTLMMAAAIMISTSVGAMIVGSTTQNVEATSQGQAIVDAAASQAGLPYCWDGGNTSGPTHGSGDLGNGGCGGTTVGFDCSGLALYAVYQGTGIVLPHGSGMESVSGGQQIANQSDLKPGDLVFFGGGSLANFEHVGIYAGSGMMWDANDFNVPVQQHSLAWEENALSFDGGVRYWTDSGTSSGGTTTPSTNWSGNFATSWGSGRLDAFTRGSSNNVNHLWYGGGWGPWDSMPTLSQQSASWPSAVSWGSGRIDLFTTAPNGNLLQAYYDGAWHNWVPIGGADTCIVGAPAVSTWGVGRLDVFAQRCYDSGVHLMHIWYNGAWSGWEILPVSGYQMASAPAAVSWGVGRIDVFAQSTSNGGRPIQAYFDANGWHGWVPLGDANTCITGAPGVSTWGVNRLDLFAQACGDNGTTLRHSYFNGAWSGWESITPTQQIKSSPSAVSWGSGRIDVFAASASGTLLHRYFDATGWHNWEDRGGSIAT